MVCSAQACLDIIHSEIKMKRREVHALAKDAAMRQQLATKLRSKLDTRHKKHVDASENGTIQSQVRGLFPSAHLSGSKYTGISS